MKKSRLIARDISVRRGRATILDVGECEVRAGEFVAVLGPNGAGKSTLLRVLSGEERPMRARVRLDGTSLGEIPLGDLARRRAVLPQSSSLDFPLTVREVVSLGRAFQPDTAPHEDVFVERAMRMTRVEALAARAYPSCSGGEQQRAQMARVLAQLMPFLSDGPAKFLMLDEATASLDLARAVEVLEMAKALSERGLGVLAVMHDPNFAMRLADRVLVLSKGRIVANGAPADVLTPELFWEVFATRVEVIDETTQHHPIIIPAASDRAAIMKLISPGEQV